MQGKLRARAAALREAAAQQAVDGKLAALMLETAADLEAEAEAMDQACRHRRCGGTGA
jgi:hypothetical protein